MTETRHIAAVAGTALPVFLFLIILPALSLISPGAQRTEKPVLHGKHWVAITGKPLAATAGARFFPGRQRRRRRLRHARRRLTMYDALSWGGETQALIFNPRTKRSSASTPWASRPPAPQPNSSAPKGSGILRRRARWRPSPRERRAG